jgi:hypothetical protein
MIRVEYEFGGRKYSNPKQFSDALMAAIMEDVGKDVMSQLRNVRCSEHGQRPSVRVKATRKDKIDFEVSGCCENLVSEATGKLK